MSRKLEQQSNEYNIPKNLKIFEDFERKSRKFWDFRKTILEEKQSFKTSEKDYLCEHVRDHFKNVRQQSDDDWPGNLLSFEFLKEFENRKPLCNQLIDFDRVLLKDF